MAWIRVAGAMNAVETRRANVAMACVLGSCTARDQRRLSGAPMPRCAFRQDLRRDRKAPTVVQDLTGQPSSGRDARLATLGYGVIPNKTTALIQRRLFPAALA